MKNLYLMRHTEPERGHPDNAERPLTDGGKQQAEDMAAWLAGHIGRVDIVIHSPFVRAVQTAKAMGAALGAHLEATRLLVPASDNPKAIYDDVMRLAQASKDVLIVGHDPSLNAFLLWMIGHNTAIDNKLPEVRMDWGTVAYLKVKMIGEPPIPDGRLMWLVTPEIVLANQEIVEAARAVVESLEPRA
jgi:phosphohistidine phosphatase SixA